MHSDRLISLPLPWLSLFRHSLPLIAPCAPRRRKNKKKREQSGNFWNSVETRKHRVASHGEGKHSRSNTRFYGNAFSSNAFVETRLAVFIKDAFSLLHYQRASENDLAQCIMCNMLFLTLMFVLYILNITALKRYSLFRQTYARRTYFEFIIWLICSIHF